MQRGPAKQGFGFALLASRLFRKRYLTSGSVTRNIFAVVFPLWIESGVYGLFWLLNIYWISRLGSESIAAVAIGERAVLLFYTVITGIANTSIAMVGALVGRNDTGNANRLTREILTITAIVSMGLGLVGYAAAPALTGLLGASPAVSSLAVGYLRIFMVSALAIFPSYVTNSIIRGAGDTRTPMLIVCGEILLNTLLDPLLIFGIGFPRMGVNGVAVASAVSSGAGTVAGLWVLARGKSLTPLKLGLAAPRLPRLTTVKEMFSLVGPNSIELLVQSIVGLVMAGIVARLGTSALAAFGIGTRLLMMFSTPGYDLAVSVAVLMSINLGAGKSLRSEASTWLIAGLNTFIMGLGGAALFLLAGSVVGIFDATPDVVRIGAGYLRLTTPGWVFLAAWTILGRAFVGAKDPYTPLVISLFSLLAVQIPLAVYLPAKAGLGINGVWCAILAAMVIQGLASAALFRAGWWKRKAAAGTVTA